MSVKRFCNGVTRRSFLQLGAAGVFGLGLDLPTILQAQERASERASRVSEGSTREVSFIFLFLHGGLSTIDTWDMKPLTPIEFRGEFRQIQTNVNGIQICEHLPRSAQQMDKFSLVRSFRHHNSDHGAADHYMFTGYFPGAGFNPSLTPNNQRPCFGSVIARKLGPRRGVPPYICLPKLHPSGGPAYLGSPVAPFVIDADPNAPNFAVPDIVPPPALAADRLDRRRELLRQLDRYQQSVERQANQNARTVGDFQREAFNLMVSPEARRAFDLQAEPARLRDEYGRNTLGQSCLMARRLVEAGVRCVTIDHSNWDTHDNNFATLRRELLPALDNGIATLFRDLADRGRLDSTLVLITGEFGRTPRINNNAGRDHWGPAFTIALGGGGIRGGRVVGASDRRAERPANDPHGPENLAATLYHLLGIDAREDFYTPEGRPVPIVNGGRVIRELL
ncbi:MAG: DUF1501 domain-containing protein [Planctomycetes bacterium]|nr:DUF1501 domain-containing protein [Planctomycetota bacterium]